MEVDARKDGDILVVSVQGKLDALTSPEFDRKFQEWVSQGHRSFIFDFGGLKYISSAGLRSVLASAKHVKTTGGKIAFSGLQGAVREVFELSGFYSILQIFDSEATALHAMQ